MSIGIGINLALRGVRLGGAGGWRGPYDSIPSITAAYGMRRLRTDYTGNILRLRRSTDNVESDFGYTSNGDLDTAAIAAWLGGASGYVVTWYDQSGNGNHAAQSTAASQPLYVASGQNGRPVLRTDGVDDMLVYTPIDATGTVLSITALATDDSFHTLLSGQGAVYLPIADGGTTTEIYRGVGTPTSYVDGVQVAPTTRGEMYNYLVTNTAHIVVFTNVVMGLLSIIAAHQIGDRSKGDRMELVIANAAWSTAQRQAAESAANAYWGVY